MKIEIETSVAYLKSDLEKVLAIIYELEKKYPHVINKDNVEIFVKCQFILVLFEQRYTDVAKHRK